MSNEEAFVNELIEYIFAYSDDDYMTMECLCRKLHKHGLIDKKDGAWTTDFIDRKTEPKQEWIPCSERLPSDGQCVIIQYYDTTGKNHVSVVGACYNARQGFVDTGYGEMWFGNGNDDVIAWRPLPEAYGEKERTSDDEEN